MKLTKVQLENLIKEELKQLLSEIGAPEDPMAAYGAAQAEAGGQEAYDRAWQIYNEGMQALHDKAKEMGREIRSLYHRAHGQGERFDPPTKEAFQKLMIRTRTSGHYGRDQGQSIIQLIMDFHHSVDKDLKKAGSRAPTDIDQWMKTKRPRHPAPTIYDYGDGRTWSDGKYSE